MSDFVRVAAVNEIPLGSMKRVVVRRLRIALYHVDGTIYATEDTCSHAEASLSEGELRGHCVTCPLHGAMFDIRTGAALSMPAVTPVKVFETRLEGSDLLVKI